MAAKNEPQEPVEVVLYTDGACSGNPGPGGWAYILHHLPSGKRSEAAGGSSLTTNNRMELRAVLHGLQRLKRPCRVRVVSDSQYTIHGMTLWMPAWRRRGWRRRTGGKNRSVRNADLWQAIAAEMDRHQVTCEHVYGHTGHPENERCDTLAVRAAEAAVQRGDPPDVDPGASDAGGDDEDKGLF